MHEEREGLIYGIVAYVLWGLLTIYWHELSGLNAFELIGQRIVGSSLLLLVVVAAMRRMGELRSVLADRRLLGRVALAAVLLTANWTSYVWAVTHGNVVETALGYFIAPLGTVAIGVIALGERLRRPQTFALSLATLAVIVLTVGYGRVPMIALVLAVTWSIYGWLKKLVPLSAIGSLTAETIVLLPVALVVVAVCETSSNAITDQATHPQLALMLLSGVVTVVPLLLFAAAAKRVPLTTLGPLQYAVPAINFVLGVVVYHEDMPVWRLLGFALVWVALVVFTVDSVRHVRSSRVAAEALEPIAD